MALRTFQTLHGTISLEDALSEEHDMLERLTYWKKKEAFLTYLWNHRAHIERIVCHHLSLKHSHQCRLTPPSHWIDGAFNICLPVVILDNATSGTNKVLIRFPLPYKVGEESNVGNADEKLRCEAATYIWIQEHCPEIPIPFLWGFAFSNDSQFTAAMTLPWHQKSAFRLRRFFLSLLGYPRPCPYIKRGGPHSLSCGYLILECIENDEVVQLNGLWDSIRRDDTQRSNFFEDLCRIILAMRRIPLPRIGSLTLDDQGIVTLTNRPLTMMVHQMENDKIPTVMGRNCTYTCSQAYYLDMLAIHSNRLSYQPNAANDDEDCQDQMAVISAMRSLLPHFISREHRCGPFHLMLTDITPQNLFVNKSGHIVYVIDLEWACSLPVEAWQPPYWLTDQAVDELTGDRLVSYDNMREEFMRVLDNTEGLFSTSEPTIAPVMEKSWDRGTYFYVHALDNVMGLSNLFYQHIQRRFAPLHLTDVGLSSAFRGAFYPYWCLGSDRFVTGRRHARQAYDASLHDIFEGKLQDESLFAVASQQYDP